MIKILFITLGHLSGGEFTIAFEFSKRLSPKKYDVCFLTSKKGEKYLIENQIKHVTLEQLGVSSLGEDKVRNRAITEKLLQEFRPDYIIASDVYTLWYSYTWTGLNMEMFQDYGIPFGSFDSYEFGSTDYVQDYYGGYKAVLPKLIDQCDFVIRYCPINKLGNADQRIKYTYLYERASLPDQAKREEFHKKYRPNGNEKVIFMTNSDWESLNVNRLPALSNLLQWTPRIIMNYLADLDEKITIIHIGPHSWELPQEVKSQIVYYHYPFLSPQEFDDLLSLSDLFITTNVISSTLAKAVYRFIPSIVLQNDKLIDFNRLSGSLSKMPPWYQKMAQEVKIVYPFRLFPFGWFHFLETVLSNNDYLDTFIQCNMFQLHKVRNLLHRYLFDTDAREDLIHRQEQYIERILQLPSSEEVIDALKDIKK